MAHCVAHLWRVHKCRIGSSTQEAEECSGCGVGTEAEEAGNLDGSDGMAAGEWLTACIMGSSNFGHGTAQVPGSLSPAVLLSDQHTAGVPPATGMV